MRAFSIFFWKCRWNFREETKRRRVLLDNAIAEPSASLAWHFRKCRDIIFSGITRATRQETLATDYRCPGSHPAFVVRLFHSFVVVVSPERGIQTFHNKNRCYGKLIVHFPSGMFETRTRISMALGDDFKRIDNPSEPGA